MCVCVWPLKDNSSCWFLYDIYILTLLEESEEVSGSFEISIHFIILHFQWTIWMHGTSKFFPRDFFRDDLVIKNTELDK